MKTFPADSPELGDFYKRGKSFKEEEIGILYPDGNVQWNPYTTGKDISTPEGRAEFLKDWKQRVQNMNLVVTETPVFVTRTKTTKFTTFTPFVDVNQ